MSLFSECMDNINKAILSRRNAHALPCNYSTF